jgi:hypothetical protein
LRLNVCFQYLVRVEKTLANLLQASKTSLPYFGPPADKTSDAFQHMETKQRR